MVDIPIGLGGVFQTIPVKTVLKSKDTFEGIKTRLNELNAMFDSLEMDDKKHKEIMWQKKSDEIEKMIEPLL